MRQFIWKIFLTEVLLVVFFVTVYETNGYAQIPPISEPGGPYGGIVDVPVPFNGSQSFDPDGVIFQYIWDFGDTSSGTGVGPTHIYTSAGTYTVTLTVIDNSGLIGLNSTTATISPPQDFCKGLTDYDQDVDGTDASMFKSHFGRSPFANPCPPDGPAPVPKTGQTTDYIYRGDGYLEKGVAWPNPRFTDNLDGTVKDNLTGLIWLKNANCFGTQSWEHAVNSVNQLRSGLCGLTDGSNVWDWRLPQIKELQSLIDFANFRPALPSGHPFTNVQPDNLVFWSSTTHSFDSDWAWFLEIDYGTIVYTEKINHLFCVSWPVRGGH